MFWPDTGWPGRAHERHIQTEEQAAPDAPRALATSPRRLVPPRICPSLCWSCTTRPRRCCAHSRQVAMAHSSTPSSTKKNETYLRPEKKGGGEGGRVIPGQPRIGSVRVLLTPRRRPGPEPGVESNAAEPLPAAPLVRRWRARGEGGDDGGIPSAETLTRMGWLVAVHSDVDVVWPLSWRQSPVARSERAEKRSREERETQRKGSGT